MRSLHDHFKGVPSARWRSPRCKTAHRTHQDQRGQASHLCSVTAALLSMEAAVQEAQCTGAHQCQGRSRLSVGAALYARTWIHTDVGCPESVGDAGDGLYVDLPGSAAAHEIADTATGSLTAVKQSTQQCLAAGSCAAWILQNRSHQHDWQSRSTVGATKNSLNGYRYQKFWNFEVRILPVEIKNASTGNSQVIHRCAI